jgi:hypothetical protein
MKKTLIILMVSLSFGINNAQAQTKEQTIQWLKAKTGNIHNPDFAKTFYLSAIEKDAHIFYTTNNYGSSILHLDFSKLTGANYIFNKEFGAYQLRLTGEADRLYKLNSDGTKEYYIQISEYEASNTYKEGGVSSVIEIWYAVSEDEIKKIKKAYEHLGKLCGANIVSDDLFKN